MELFGSHNCLLVIDTAVFGQTTQIGVVKDTWDDGLADHATSLEVNKAGGQVVKLRSILFCQHSQTFHVVVSLCETWELVD